MIVGIAEIDVIIGGPAKTVVGGASSLSWLACLIVTSTFLRLVCSAERRR